jgi:SagB-type dehydrogenase family enzyme
MSQPKRRVLDGTRPNSRCQAADRPAFAVVATNLQLGRSMLAKLLSSFIGNLKADRASERSLGALVLPPPQVDAKVPLMEALSRRRSARTFRTSQLPAQLLSNLLWSAFGINRPEDGGRTAPSALNAQEIDIYVALAAGLYIYAPRTHSLQLVAAVDARRVTGYQDFADHAPLDLIYVADFAHTLAGADERRLYAGVSTGAIVQNVYLYCAASGLATVARAFFDRSALRKTLGLGEREEVLLTQTVGYPA